MIDGRTTRHRGYAISQRIRKRIEKAFGWIKAIARQDKTSFRSRDRVGWASPSQPPLIIWCGCQSSWRCQHDRAVSRPRQTARQRLNPDHIRLLQQRSNHP